ncbi:MAG: hypothetical protein ACE37F_14865 [Nannocystaceae bacterium]|nr:hypothetical protein [bacterium]
MNEDEGVLAGVHPVRETEDDVIVVWRSMVLVQSLGTPSVDGADAIVSGLHLLRERGVVRPLLYAFVSKTAAPPPDEARVRLTTALRDPALQLAGHVILFSGSAFRATIVRSVLTGMTLLSRQSYPSTAVWKLEASVEAACGYLRDAGSRPAVEPDQLAAFLREFLPPAAT